MQGSLLLFLVVVSWAWITMFLGISGYLPDPATLDSKIIPCTHLYEFSFRCEPSNLATMYMELLFAFVVGGIISYWFYDLGIQNSKKVEKIISKQDDERIHREKTAQEMIGENLVYQGSLLYSLLTYPDKSGRLTFSGQHVTNYDFVKEGIITNNDELSLIESVFSREIEREFLQKLIKFSSNITFIFKQDSKVTDIGLNKSREAIGRLLEKHLPQYMDQFKKQTS